MNRIMLDGGLKGRHTTHFRHGSFSLIGTRSVVFRLSYAPRINSKLDNQFFKNEVMRSVGKRPLPRPPHPLGGRRERGDSRAWQRRPLGTFFHTLRVVEPCARRWGKRDWGSRGSRGRGGAPNMAAPQEKIDKPTPCRTLAGFQYDAQWRTGAVRLRAGKARAFIEKQKTKKAGGGEGGLSVDLPRCTRTRSEGLAQASHAETAWHHAIPTPATGASDSSPNRLCRMGSPLWRLPRAWPSPPFPPPHIPPSPPHATHTTHTYPTAPPL